MAKWLRFNVHSCQTLHHQTREASRCSSQHRCETEQVSLHCPTQRYKGHIGTPTFALSSFVRYTRLGEYISNKIMNIFKLFERLKNFFNMKRPSEETIT